MMDTEVLEVFEPVNRRLDDDLKKAAREMGPDAARFLVAEYYKHQADRIRNRARLRELEGENIDCLTYLATQNDSLEHLAKAMLDQWSNAQPLGVWARSHKGVGPVIAAGLLAHIDLEKAPVSSSVIRFAGLDPSLKWYGKVEAAAMIKTARQHSPAAPVEALIYRSAESWNRKPTALLRDATRTPKGESRKLTLETLTAALAKRPWNADLKVLCVRPDCAVTTKRGPLPIERVVVGDEVLTHRGRWRSVTKVFVNNHDGQLFGLRAANSGNQVAWLTGGHPVYAADCETWKSGRTIKVKPDSDGGYGWHAVEDVLSRWKLLRPTVQQEVDSLSPIRCHGVEVGYGRVAAEGKHLGIAHPTANSVKARIQLTPELMRLLGLYIAEGHRNRTRIIFSLHIDESELAEFITGQLRALVPDAVVSTTPCPEHNSVQIGVCCKPLADALQLLVGHSSLTMRIPMEWLSGPDELLEPLFQGIMEGDGDHQGRLAGKRISSANCGLAHEVLILARRLGYSASMHSEKTGRAYRVMLNNRPDVEPRARETLIERYCGKVYNLEVEEDHSYLVEGYAVHNCWKLGECFVKVSGYDDAFYGKLYQERKALDVARNEARDFSGQAFASLSSSRAPGKGTEAYAHYKSGKLPPARVHLRATRYAVKLFLSHYHEVGLRLQGKTPPKPWVIEHGGHGHYIPPPNLSAVGL